MLCPSCGAEHDPASGGFCDACGLWVGHAAPALAKDEGQPCPECGVRMTGTSCRQCGARARPTDQDVEAAAERRRRRILREREQAAAPAVLVPDGEVGAGVEPGVLANDDAPTAVPDAAPDTSLAGVLEPTRPDESTAHGSPHDDAGTDAAAGAFAADAGAAPDAAAEADRDAAIEAELAALMAEAEPPAEADAGEVVFAPMPRDE